ncbi:MAG: hypothetical protein ACAH09_04450 [Methylophilaceae bacterium]
MNALLTGIALLVLLLTALLCLEIQRRNQRCEQRRNGLQAVQQGIALMTVVQQHRGISAALLNGDQAFAPRQIAKQAEIDAALTTLNLTIQADRALASSREDLKSLSEEWAGLRTGVRNLDPTLSFIQHTDLVRRVLHFIGDIGERAGLLEVRDRRVAKLLETLLLRLPLLVETVGQVRAMGTGFAAKGRCGAVGRIRLTFMGRRIDDCLSQIDPSLKDLGQDSQAKVKVLLDLLTSRIIAAEHIDIAPERYYQVSTEAIDACLVLWRKAAGIANTQLAQA